MKVLHCINSPSIGGIQKLVVDLAVNQKQRRIEVAIMLDSREGAYYDILIENNIEIMDSGSSGGYDFSITKLKKIKSIFKQFDIVHLHNFSVLRSMAMRSTNVVYTVHGLSKGIRKENILKYIFREGLKKFFLNRVDVLACNSEHTLNKVKLDYGLTKTFTKVILNGVPIAEETNHNIPKLENEFTIGLVSRFTHRKRLDRLINGFEIFLKNDGKGRLILVGDGEAKPDVETQIQSLGLEDKIELVGFTNDVNAYYRKFHVCVHPSDNEGFGLVAVEAYLQGLPVIAFNDSGGLVEVVSPLEPENIVNSENQLAERLLYYQKNRNLIVEGALNRIEYATNNFSLNRMTSDYLETYKEIVSR